MRIAIASDLHFEFYRNKPEWLPPLPSNCDVLVLAGDIGVGQEALDAAFKIADLLTDIHIIWVAGNHEFYKQCINKQTDSYRAACANHDRVHFLENEVVVINGYRFLGCTLWTGFNCLGDDLRHLALHKGQNEISDFSLIRKENGEKPFRALDALSKFNESYKWLKSELSKENSAKTVVVTHFPPSRQARHQKIEEDLLSAYFQADCEPLIKEFQPALWLYGHNHWSDDMIIDKTRVISNQYGYPGEQDIPDFSTDKIVFLDGKQ